ncbi:MAG: cytochrome c [Sphingomonadaceae bacterium]|nr:cytochrome c [Sphingomonadaceae bacterium]
MRKIAIFSAAFALGLAACQPVEERPVTAAPAPDPALVKQGADLADALCSGCHAVKPGEISPNPNSPSFEMVANARGLTQDTLGSFLRNSHNFPERMNFEVAEEDGEALAAYMITLRREDYQQPIE